MSFVAFRGYESRNTHPRGGVLSWPAGRHAQVSERFLAFGDIGYARTWDDEGLLGAGASLTGGFGVRLTPRLTVQAIVDRVGYHRDEDWLTFDGRVIFAGVEAAFSSSGRKVRGYLVDWRRRLQRRRQRDLDVVVRSAAAAAGTERGPSRRSRATPWPR